MIGYLKSTYTLDIQNSVGYCKRIVKSKTAVISGQLNIDV